MQNIAMPNGATTEEDTTQETPAASIPETDPRLQAALDQQRKLELYSGLLKGIQQIGSAKSIGYGYKPDYTGSDILSKAAKQPVEDYKMQLGREDVIKKQKMAQEKAQRDLETHRAQMDQFQINLSKSKLDLTNEEVANSPEVQQMAANRFIETQKKLGRPINEQQVRGMSAKQIMLLSPQLQDDVASYYKDKELELKAQEIRSKEKIEEKKAKEPDFAEKEKIKAETKDDVKIKSENRKERKKLDADYTTWDNLETLIDDAIAKAGAYSKNNIAGTGLVASIKGLGGSLSPDTQSLETALSKLGLDQMVKQFSGMSKAIDTPAERAAFQATVPTKNMDDKLLMEELLARKAAASSAKTKIKSGLAEFDRSGNFIKEETRTPQSDNQPQAPTGPYGDTTERNGKIYKWNPTAGKYQLLGQ